jgi:hypothetical protein
VRHTVWARRVIVGSQLSVDDERLQGGKSAFCHHGRGWDTVVEAVEAEDLHQTSLTSDSALSRHMTIEIHFEYLAGRRRPHLLYLVQGVEAGLIEIG